MKRLAIIIFAPCILLLIFLSLVLNNANAQVPSKNSYKELYFQAEILEIVEESRQETLGFAVDVQRVRAKILNGSERGKIVEIKNEGNFGIFSSQKLYKDEKIVLLKTESPGESAKYMPYDKYRIQPLLIILGVFAGIVIFIAGKKGIGSLVGLAVSVLVVFGFIVPQILQGRDPLLISIIGSLVIMLVTMYLAHGFSRKVTVALVATFLSLTITGFLAYWFVDMVNLSGLSEESAAILKMGNASLNLRGLLLGGIIIGALGVLDDVTTAQSSTVFELAGTDKTLKFKELFLKGYNIGKDHISSLVNTLVLAYAGASLSLVILFVVNPSKQPNWVIFNGELISEEIVRTLTGSIGLILSVPLTTALAAWAATQIPSKRGGK